MEHSALSPFTLLVLYGGLVFLSSLGGGWLLLVVRMTHERLQMAVSFVAGLMLGIALLHFVPNAVEESHSPEGTVRWLLGGFLLMFFLQRFFPHHHHDVAEGAPEDHAHDLSPKSGAAQHVGHPTLAEQSASQLSWAATTVGMTLHSVLGGLALAAAVAAGAQLQAGLAGLGVAVAIVLHKPFDAMAVVTLMAASGCSRLLRHTLNGLFALITPLSALLFFVGASALSGLHPASLGAALAICAGTFLCIACADLLPELQFHSHDRVKLSLALLAGVGIAALMGVLESSVHEEHAHQARASAFHFSPVSAAIVRPATMDVLRVSGELARGRLREPNRGRGESR
jgi:zinc and cadmium transporter